MLEIKHDKSYLTGREGLKGMGFTDVTVFKICFQGMYSDDSSIVIQEIRDYLELKYKMYQYKKDNGIKYGEEELFYWHNGDTRYNDFKRYFDVTLKDNNSIEHNERISKEIEQYVKDNYPNANLYVRFQYTDRIDWDKVNDYIENFELDLENIPFEELHAVTSYMFCCGSHYNEKSMEKLTDIENQLMKFYEGKKVIYNGIKGTLKHLGNNNYGVFKPRATRTYYPIELKTIKELKIA